MDAGLGRRQRYTGGLNEYRVNGYREFPIRPRAARNSANGTASFYETIGSHGYATCFA